MAIDPISLFIIGAIGFGATAAVTIVFWHQILGWAESNLFPWFDRHLPTVSPYVRSAFSSLDNVITSIRRTIKEAWQKVREFLLKQVVKLRRKTSSTWVQETTSYVLETSGYSKPVVKEVRTETEVSYDDLPADVREQYLRRNQTSYEKDVTAIRDQEMAYVN
jgi:hypothetical protein